MIESQLQSPLPWMEMAPARLLRAQWPMASSPLWRPLAACLEDLRLGGQALTSWQARLHAAAFNDSGNLQHLSCPTPSSCKPPEMHSSSQLLLFVTSTRLASLPLPPSLSLGGKKVIAQMISQSSVAVATSCCNWDRHASRTTERSTISECWGAESLCICFQEPASQAAQSPLLHAVSRDAPWAWSVTEKPWQPI